MIEVKLYATLRSLVGSKSVMFQNNADTVGVVLEELIQKYPDLDGAIFAEPDVVRPFVAIMVNGRDIRHLNGLETMIHSNDTVDIFPPIAGGSAPCTRNRFA